MAGEPNAGHSLCAADVVEQGIYGGGDADAGVGYRSVHGDSSVIENVLLAPFPYKDAERLMYMTIHDS